MSQPSIVSPGLAHRRKALLAKARWAGLQKKELKSPHERPADAPYQENGVNLRFERGVGGRWTFDTGRLNRYGVGNPRRSY